MSDNSGLSGRFKVSLRSRTRAGTLHRASELIYYLGTGFTSVREYWKKYECKKLIRISLGRRTAPGNIVFIHVVDNICVHVYKTYFTFL